MPAERKSMTARWTFQVPDIPTDPGGQRVGSQLSTLTRTLFPFIGVSLTV